jgi:hypothetical protein
MFLIMWDRRAAGRVLVGWPEGKRPPGKPRSRWEDVIKKESSRFGVGRQELDWCGSGKGEEADACECGYEPLHFIKCEEFLTS